MQYDTDSRAAHVAMEAVFVLGRAFAIAASLMATMASPWRGPGCWASTPAELAPLACGEHGALAGNVGA
jgi:hypothetical protein